MTQAILFLTYENSYIDFAAYRAGYYQDMGLL